MKIFVIFVLLVNYFLLLSVLLSFIINRILLLRLVLDLIIYAVGCCLGVFRLIEVLPYHILDDCLIGIFVNHHFYISDQLSNR